MDASFCLCQQWMDSQQRGLLIQRVSFASAAEIEDVKFKFKKSTLVSSGLVIRCTKRLNCRMVKIGFI